MKKPIWFESPCGTSGVGTSDEPFTKIEVATNTIIQLAKIIKTPLIKFRDHERQNSRPSRSTLTVESQQNSYLTTLAAMYDTNLQDQRLALDAYAAREPFQFDDAFNLTERPDEHLQNEDAGDDENDGGVQLPPFERDPEVRFLISATSDKADMLIESEKRCACCIPAGGRSGSQRVWQGPRTWTSLITPGVDCARALQARGTITTGWSETVLGFVPMVY